MSVRKGTRAPALLAFVVLLLSLVSPASAQSQSRAKKKKEIPRGTPVMWRAPEDIASRDLFDGPGGEAGRPDVRRVTFVEQETGGYSPKFRVRDAAGRVWVAKMGKEAQPETAAVRLLWAVGYPTEVNYLVPCVRIEGAPRPSKEVERCAGGGFANVRFEARPAGVKRAGEWKWKQNPFVGKRELRGLAVMMALFNNWDLKDSNNVILAARNPRTGRQQLRHAISDLGATFGKTGSGFIVWRLTRSRNEPEDYVKSDFVEGVKRGRVSFNYGGKNQGLFDDIRVEEARWIGRWLARLSDRQIADAFRAANYSPDEIRLLASAVRSRANELVNLPRGGRAAVGRRR
ncbi:MAG TPA: hypothetical protein VER08_07585 [Pyrinomonadaceae bacterium]|nr:hypothetical protein [Pyrinomonadaceae bacterium]